MIVLTIRTDRPDAELGLYDGDRQLAHCVWLAHRQLSATIHQKIEELLTAADKQMADVQGIVCFQGPGSFTGLRIGLSVGNALAYGLSIPVVATQDDDWVVRGIHRLEAGDQDGLALPHYGADANITLPRK